jgi:magnesium chelatase subunit I
LSADELLKRTAAVQGLHELALGTDLPAKAPAPHRAAAVDFLLEGLYAQKKISRSDQFQYIGSEQPRRPARTVQTDPRLDPDLPMPGNKKKYYN